MTLLWTLEAIQDRQRIYDHIEVENPTAAMTLDEMFSKKAHLLESHPELGRPGRVPGTRELVVHQSYIVIYDITVDAVRILRVLHAALQWPKE